MRDSKVFLKDILAAMDSIEEFVRDTDLKAFIKDDKTSSAVVKKFENIGEAAKHIPDDVRARYSDIPWKEMAGLRDRLIHFYFGIKYELVWETIKTVIPQVRPKLEKAVRDFENAKEK